MVAERTGGSPPAIAAFRGCRMPDPDIPDMGVGIRRAPPVTRDFRCFMNTALSIGTRLVVAFPK
jgi:hypothetical protein